MFPVQVDDENLSDNKLHKNNSNHKRLRKKYQVSESEDEDILQDENEDNCLLSALKKKADVKAQTSEDNQKNDMLSAKAPHRTENGGTVEHEKAK